MNKYKIVAHLITPDLQDAETRTAEYCKDYEDFRQGNEESNKKFLEKYPIDSDAYEHFNSEDEFIFDEDADGIYLFKKI